MNTAIETLEAARKGYLNSAKWAYDQVQVKRAATEKLLEEAAEAVTKAMKLAEAIKSLRETC